MQQCTDVVTPRMIGGRGEKRRGKINMKQKEKLSYS